MFEGDRLVRRSWRVESHEGKPSVALLRTRRLIITFFGLGLLSILGLLLVIMVTPSPELWLVGMAVTDYDVPYAPAIEFARDDVAALRSLAVDASGRTKRDRHDVAVWSETHPVQHFMEGSLPDKLRQAGDKDDILVFYLSAHAVSYDGVPYLLCSDYNPATGEGRYPARKLLEAMSASPAQLKLLVLDGGRFDADPSTGMLVNEFPALVEEEMQRPEVSSSLWLLLSNSLLERSHFSASSSRSVFNFYFVEGLRGAADEFGVGDRNGAVELDELHDFVVAQVSGCVARASGSTEWQTPRLLRGGVGASVPEKLFLTAAVRHRRAELPRLGSPTFQHAGLASWFTALLAADSPPQAAAPGNQPSSEKSTSPPPASPPGEATSGTTPAAKPSAPGAPAPATQASTPAGAPPAAAAKEAPGGTATPPPAPAPPSAAPPPAAEAPPAAKPGSGVRASLSKQYEFAASALDRAKHDGWSPVDFAPHLWRRYYELLLSYEQRSRGGAAASDATSRGLLEGRVEDLNRLRERLEKRRQEFARGASKESYEGYRLADAVRLRDDVIMAAPGYIAWYGSVLKGAPDEEFASNLSDELDATERLVRLLENPPREAQEPNAPRSGAGLSEAEKWLDAVERSRQQILVLRGKLEKYLDDVISRSAASTSDEREYSRADLSICPALSPAEHLRLNRDVGSTGLAVGSVRSVTPPANLDKQWQRALRRSALELRLLRMLGRGKDKSTVELEGLLAEVEKSFGETSRDRSQAVRRLGQAVAAAYRRLPEKFETDAASPGAGQRAAEMDLRLCLARDALTMDDKLDRLRGRSPLADVPIWSRPRIQRIELAGPSTAVLELDQPRKLQWAVEGSEPLPRGLAAVLEYDAAQLRVTDVLGRDVPPGKPDACRVEADQSRTVFEYQLTARREGAGPAPLVVRLLGGDTKGPRPEFRTMLDLPKPAFVELRVGPPEAVDASRPGNRDTVVLRPFSSGQTDFTAELCDRSGRGQKARIRLIALAGVRGLDDPRVRLDNIRRAALSGGKTLMDKQVELPPGEKFVPLPEWGVAAPAAPMGAEKPPAAAAPAAEPPKDPPVTAGLALVIEDLATARRQTIWIDVRPRHPEEYVQDPEVWFDADRSRLRVRVSAVRPDMLPAEGCPVVWDPIPKFCDDARTKGTIDAPRPSLDLYAALAADPNRTESVDLAVDGYPRAFLYRNVACWGGTPAVRAGANLKDIKITAPAEDSAFSDTASIPVAFRVDAPSSTADDFYYFRCGIQSDLSGAGDRDYHEFFRERLFDVRLGKPQGGVLSLLTKVDDLKFDLNTEGYRNKEIRIVAEIVHVPDGGEPKIIATDARNVKIDSEPPAIVVRGVAGDGRIRIEQGKPLDISLVAYDKLSGVDKVEAGFKEQDGKLQNPTPANRSPDDDRIYRAIVPTADLAIGLNELKIRASDRVGLSRTLVVIVNVEPAPPTPPPGSPAPSATSSITGFVQLGGTPVGRITVTLEGPKPGSAVSDASGYFAFRDLPPGDYKLSAFGIARNRERKTPAPQNVTLSPPPAPPPSVALSIE